jgi:large subunit ribosomal protein L21
MHAVIASGGKQYRVMPEQVVRLEKLSGAVGDEIVFDHVLMVIDGDKVNVGAPHVAGAKVKAQVLSHGRERKVRILKFKRRKHHMKQMGHRQYYTEVKITGIDD